MPEQPINRLDKLAKVTDLILKNAEICLSGLQYFDVKRDLFSGFLQLPEKA